MTYAGADGSSFGSIPTALDDGTEKIMKYTVITIAYNEEKNIAKTMKSVLIQDYEDLEYLVIDGASSDHTAEIANRLAEESGRDVKIYSEPDFGIYNAMNRGIMRASGDYVIFMNAGDSFCCDTVLSDIERRIRQNGKAVYYGQAYLMRNGRCTGKNTTKHKFLLKGNMPIHQSVAAPLSLLKKYYFNEKYKIRGDYDWMLRCYRAGIKFVNMDFPVCRYENSGLSARASMKKLLQQETVTIRRDIYPIIGRICERLGM